MDEQENVGSQENVAPVEEETSSPSEEGSEESVPTTEPVEDDAPASAEQEVEDDAPAEAEMAAEVPESKGFMYSGKKVIRDMVRIVNGREYHSVVLVTGETLDITDEEYTAMVEESV